MAQEEVENMTKCKTDRCDAVKLKSFGTNQANASKERREAESLESILTASISVKGLLSKTR